MVFGSRQLPKGLFGTPGYGDGTPMGGPQQRMMAQPPQMSPQDTYQRIDAISGPSEPQHGKVNWGGIAADFLAGLGGREGPYLAQLQAERARADKERDYQRQRMDRRDDYVWQQEHRNNDTEADFDFWKSRLTPEQFETWKQNKINPPMWRQGPDGQFYRMDTGGQSATPKVIGPQLDGDWEMEGDGASNGAGGFPRR